MTWAIRSQLARTVARCDNNIFVTNAQNNNKTYRRESSRYLFGTRFVPRSLFRGGSSTRSGSRGNVAICFPQTRPVFVTAFETFGRRLRCYDDGASRADETPERFFPLETYCDRIPRGRTITGLDLVFFIILKSGFVRAVEI